MGSLLGMHEPMHFGAVFGNCRSRSGAPACGDVLGKAQKAVRPAIRALSKSHPKMRRKLLLRGAQRFLGGNDAFRHGDTPCREHGAPRRNLSTLAASLASEKPSPGRGPRRFTRLRPGEPVTLLPRRVPGLSVL